MKYLSTIILLTLLGCNQPVHPIKHTSKALAWVIDTSKYAIFKFDPNRDNYIFDSQCKTANLNANDISDIETIISNKVISYNKHEIAFWDSVDKKQPKITISQSMGRSNYDTISHPDRYCKQFIAITDSEGDKIVWVNCFCDKEDFSYWKKGIVIVDDGGTSFFQVKINLTKKKVLNFSVNGVA